MALEDGDRQGVLSTFPRVVFEPTIQPGKGSGSGYDGAMPRHFMGGADLQVINIVIFGNPPRNIQAPFRVHQRGTMSVNRGQKTVLITG